MVRFISSTAVPIPITIVHSVRIVLLSMIRLIFSTAFGTSFIPNQAYQQDDTNYHKHRGRPRNVRPVFGIVDFSQMIINVNIDGNRFLIQRIARNADFQRTGVGVETVQSHASTDHTVKVATV